LLRPLIQTLRLEFLEVGVIEVVRQRRIFFVKPIVARLVRPMSKIAVLRGSKA